MTFKPEFPIDFNLADYFLDQRIAEGKGDRVAIVAGETTQTYAKVQAEANRMADVLSAAGVAMEDRVLIVLPDCPLFAAAYFGTLKCGAVVTMVNPRLPVEDYAYYIEYTRARVVICDEDLYPRIKEYCDGSRHLRAVLRRGGGLEESMKAAPTSFDNAPTTRDDIAVWLFTSGSTGKPKAAVHMHHDFAFNTEAYAKRVLQMTQDDVTLGVPKLFFGYATGTNLMFPFAVGAKTVLFEKNSTPTLLFDLIEKHKPTVLTSVPTMIGKMLATAGAKERDLSSLRVTISAGEALPEELYKRWRKAYGSEILDGIGSAELFHIYISNRIGEARMGSLGKLVPGYEARIVDDDGNEVNTGEIGTLHVKGDSAALCYFGAHEESKEVFAGDWVISGDKFLQDDEGFFTYAGRADDLLKIGGIFVAPIEVEHVLMQHPGVLECVVVGYQDDEKLTKAKAVVVIKEGSGYAQGDGLETELVTLAREKLAHYKVPRAFEYRASLPRNDRGKIMRRTIQ